MTNRYEAAWCPGLTDSYDPDESLRVAYAWLAKAERRVGRKGVIVMNAALMRRNRPMLAQAPWEIVSPHTRRPRGNGPVLAIYPADKTLELAEDLAGGSALCVVGGSLFDVTPWIQRTRATCLVDGFAMAMPTVLPAEIANSLDHMLFFDGHNGFLGGGGKEDAIRRLREISRRRDAPSREEVEQYLHASGQTGADGVRRAGKWYEEILDGKRHRDYRGQTIT